MAPQQPPSRRVGIPDDEYFKLKELASLRGKGHVVLLMREIFQDYIKQHENELLKV